MSEWVHVRKQQDNVWKLPSERVDVLMRFLTRDGRETGRTQRSQDEEEEPYTMKTKTSTWRDEEVPDLLVMRADAVWTSCEQQHWSVHSRVYTSCPASCCSTGSAPLPRLHPSPGCSHMFLFERVGPTTCCCCFTNSNYTTCQDASFWTLPRVHVKTTKQLLILNKWNFTFQSGISASIKLHDTV